MNLNIVFDIIQAISVITASIVAVYGISSWRRETKWKRKYELAEEVLSCFYDISDRFDIIRNPVAHLGEGQTRIRNNDETPDDSQILDNAYVIVERYEREKDAFIKIRSLKFRFTVLFGNKAGEPFDEIFQLRNKLFLASYRLGTKFWREQGRRHFSDQQFEKHLQGMKKQEAILWADYDEKDEFKESINNIINNIESICRNIIEKK